MFRQNPSLRGVTLSLGSALIASLGLLSPASAQQTFTSSSGPSITSNGSHISTSNLTVSGASGSSIATVQVKLNGVVSNGSTGNSVFYTTILLSSSTSGKQIILLGSTGDGVDGDDNADSGSGIGTAGSGATITIKDGASAAPDSSNLSNSFWTPQNGTFTVKPSSYWTSAQNGIPFTYSGKKPQTDGSDTLNATFNGAAANDTWTLTLRNDGSGGTPVSISSWSLTFTYNSLITTTTSLSSSANPGNVSSNVTFTGTVSTTSASGTITFAKSGTNLSCSEGANPRPISNGQATCTVSGSSLGQGLSAISASYSGDSTYGSSSGSLNELVEVTTSHSSGTNTFCNTQGFSVSNGTTPQVYPSVIKVTGYPTGTTVSTVTSVVLNNISWLGNPSQHLLVSPDGATGTKNTTHNLDFLDRGWSSQSTSFTPVTLTFEDGASGSLSSGNPSTGTYPPYDNNSNSPTWPSGSSTTAVDSNIPSVPSSINFPTPIGSSSNIFLNKFTGATANGDWALYVYDNGNTSESIAGGWCITLEPATGTATTTTVTTSANPATQGSALTLTATVKDSSGNPVTSGNVTFLDNNAAPAGTSGGNNIVNLNSSGKATFTTSSLTEGDHPFTITYNGDTTFSLSTTSYIQRVDHATSGPTSNSGAYEFCNTGAISISGTTGAFTPNPSIISIANLPGTLSSVAVTLKNMSAASPQFTQSLVQGPEQTDNTTPSLDFFSNTVGSSGGMNTGNYTFTDSASSTVEKNGSTLAAGSYKPTSYPPNSGSDTFTSSSFGSTSFPAYLAPSSFSQAQPSGAATFVNTFSGKLPNGSWGLFFNQSAAEGTVSIGSGWCLDLKTTAVTVAATASHTGTFSQGDASDPITVAITNNGAGSTGDPLGTNPMTVVDTLGTGLSYVSGSGTGWSCSNSSQTVTCTNDSSIAQGSSYPTLTINVSVSSSASSPIPNQVSVSGAGAQSANSNTDSIPIVESTTTAVNNESTTYSAGSQSITLGAKVTSGATNVNEGSVTFDVFQGSTLIGTGVTTTTVSGGVFTASYTLPAGTAAATYSIHATFNGDSNYALSSNNSATLTINAVTPTFTWSPASTIIFGDAGAGVLNASVNCTSCGTITYTETPSGSSTPVAITQTTSLAAGAYTITANFTASSGNYNNVSATNQLTVSSQSVWLVNGGGGTSELAGNGSPISTSAYPGANFAVAIDAIGNVWTVGSGSPLLNEINQVGTQEFLATSGGGLNVPSAIAIDGNSAKWITNTGNNSVSLFLIDGTASSPSTGFTDSSLSNPSGVTVDLGGSVWISNQGNNSLTRVLGAAAPAAPLSTAAANNTTGVKP